MRKLLITSVLLFIALSINAQKYWDTHDPSPDSIMPNIKVSTVGGIYSFSSVDSVPKKTKEQLFSTAKEWIGRTFRDPKTVIKSENPPTQIVFEGQLTSSENGGSVHSIHGKMELNFKDGRYKWTISNMISYWEFMGQMSKSYIEDIPRYSISKGDRAAKWLIAELYTFLSNFKVMMQGQTDDDW